MQQVYLIRFFEVFNRVGEQVSESVHQQCWVLDHVNPFQHVVEGSPGRRVATDEEPGL